MLQTNESHSDRVIRVLIGIVAAVLAVAHIGGMTGTWIFGSVAVLALVTGITGICWLYRIVGINTCPVRR